LSAEQSECLQTKISDDFANISPIWFTQFGLKIDETGGKQHDTSAAEMIGNRFPF